MSTTNPKSINSDGFLRKWFFYLYLLRHKSVNKVTKPLKQIFQDWMFYCLGQELPHFEIKTLVYLLVPLYVLSWFLYTLCTVLKKVFRIFDFYDYTALCIACTVLNNQACNIYKYWSYDRNLRLLSRNAGCVCWEVSQQSPGECFVWVADFCCFSLTLGSPMINPVSIPLGFFIWHTMTVIKSILAYWK